MSSLWRPSLSDARYLLDILFLLFSKKLPEPCFLSMWAPFVVPLCDVLENPGYSDLGTPFIGQQLFSRVKGLLFQYILALFFGTPFQSSIVNVLCRFWGPLGPPFWNSCAIFSTLCFQHFFGTSKCHHNDSKWVQS